MKIEWNYTPGLTPYLTALATMEGRVQAIQTQGAAELIWFLQHPSLYTAGTSSARTDLLSPDRFPVYQAGRGGSYTYHGPGQLITYVMLDLNKRGRDLHSVA